MTVKGEDLVEFHNHKDTDGFPKLFAELDVEVEIACLVLRDRDVVAVEGAVWDQIEGEDGVEAGKGLMVDEGVFVGVEEFFLGHHEVFDDASVLKIWVV